MFTYADTVRCPACREPLPPRPVSCPSCDLPLQHPLTTQLFGVLASADRLVAQLDTITVTTRTAPPAASPRIPTVVPPALPSAEQPRRTGVRTASVPSILLGLGALCLVVAAVAFLAVAWSWLGVGGRTVVLALLTAAAGTSGLLLDRRGLRAAAESLTAVAAGLCCLDVVGAAHSGWLGSTSGATLGCAIGAVLVIQGTTATVVSRRLVTAQLGTAAGLLVLSQTILDLVDGAPLLLATVMVVALAAVAEAAHRLALSCLASAVAGVAALTWLQLVALTMAQLADLPSLSWSHLWLGGPGWALAAAAVLVTLVLLADRRRGTVLAAAATTASMLTVLVALPSLDEGTSAITLTALSATVVWVAVAFTLPRGRAVVAQVPAVLAALPLTAVVLGLVVESVDRALTPGTDLRLADGPTLAQPALLVPGALALLAVAACLVRAGRRGWVVAALVVAAVSVVATLGLRPVPLWTVVVSAAAVALAGGAVALRIPGRTGQVAMLAAFGLAVGDQVAARPDDGLATVVAATLVVLALDSLGGHQARLGGAALPLAVALLLEHGARLADLDPAYVGVPVLIVVGVLAIARPRVELELAAIAATLVAAPLAVAAAADLSVSLAVHLTLAGALVTVTSLVNPMRRSVAWAGGVLLGLATWVRLADLGVHAPEAYTLPAALVLIAVGLLQLRRRLDSATATTLTPGLVLATVPSLLWVLATDPVSARALLLGLGCLVMVLAGAGLRWSAPLVVGAVVGAMLVLVELAPYAAAVPQWASLATAGALLTLVGVTWERRLLEVRRAAGFVGRLR